MSGPGLSAARGLSNGIPAVSPCNRCCHYSDFTPESVDEVTCPESQLEGQAGGVHTAESGVWLTLLVSLSQSRLTQETVGGGAGGGGASEQKQKQKDYELQTILDYITRHCPSDG